MSLILAIEPDRRQAAQLTEVVFPRLKTEGIIAASAERALAKLGDRIPDLILTSALLSPRDEVALADRLRALAGAASYVQTLTIPVLAAPQAKRSRRSVLSKLRRQYGDAVPEGCDPKEFAEQCVTYLERARAERALAEATLRERAEIAPALVAPVTGIVVEAAPEPDVVAELAFVDDSTPEASGVAMPVERFAFESSPVERFVVQRFVGERPVFEMPAVETSAIRMPAVETFAFETPTLERPEETSALQTAGVERLALVASTVETPAVETIAIESSVVVDRFAVERLAVDMLDAEEEPPAVETFRAEIALAPIPPADLLHVETPSVQMVVFETAAVETPAIEIPVIDAPAFETVVLESAAVEVAVAETSAVATTALGGWAIEVLALEAPSVDMSSFEIPLNDMSESLTPLAEMFAAEVPIAEGTVGGMALDDGIFALEVPVVESVTELADLLPVPQLAELVIPETPAILKAPVTLKVPAILEAPAIPETPAILKPPVTLEAPAILKAPAIPEAPAILEEPVIYELAAIEGEPDGPVMLEDLWAPLPPDAARFWPTLEGEPAESRAVVIAIEALHERGVEPLDDLSFEELHVFEALAIDVVQNTTVAASVSALAPVTISVAQHTAPDQQEPPHPIPRRSSKHKAIQDEWGLFDPEQCGFAALLKKLDEITNVA